jgi:hypothetical protein
MALALQTTYVVQAADKEQWIKSDQIMGYLAADRQLVELTLKDGSVVYGLTQKVDDQGVRISVESAAPGNRVNPPQRVIRYQDISEVRVARQGRGPWRTFGIVLGAAVGYVAGAGAAGLSTNDGRTVALTAFGSAPIGAVLGGWLGGKHKDRLTLHIRDN